ncbi:phosphotransferase [Komarekiella sp. 'clone 1']|uniref:Phosphotransferase n=1 Tax=Komarekiella delphini-convector SJRDD-AB1 TaxID=2593771 RepID=A0AA40SSU0_9NOST|nr:phosphotransferase [Komarekiella delphini-convector]MBD6614394.1 phosphotransferase [Komarekiella delphini-convector SJRDD-AB1]
MQDNIYDYIAKAALAQYGIAQGECCFLAHSGSVTFCIKTQTKKFLLRIHRPISMLYSDVWQRPQVIESELLWLAALRNDTEIVVQEPVKNLQDKWVTQVLADETGEVFYCSLLHWIDGGNILNAQRTPQQAYQLGLLLARLHQHSSQWQLPQNFVRPAYDQNRLQAAFEALYPAVLQELISAEDYKTLEVAACQVQGMIETLGQEQNVWGLIHADLHEGNYLLHNEEFRPIDFALCGFGYYLYDMASSLQYLLPTVRPSFFEGYQTIRKLPEHYLQITEGFFLMALIDVLSFHVNNPQEHQGISESVPYIVKEHVPMYLEGESFLFEKY